MPDRVRRVERRRQLVRSERGVVDVRGRSGQAVGGERLLHLLRRVIEIPCELDFLVANRGDLRQRPGEVLLEIGSDRVQLHADVAGSKPRRRPGSRAPPPPSCPGRSADPCPACDYSSVGPPGSPGERDDTVRKIRRRLLQAAQFFGRCQRVRRPLAGPRNPAKHDRPHVRRGKSAEVMPEQRYERPVRPPTLELTMINPHLRDQLGDTRALSVPPPGAFGCIDTARICASGIMCRSQ